VSVQVSMCALALVQALLQALVSVLPQASVLVLVLVQALSQASVQASVQVSAPESVQAPAHSCPPPCRLLWRRSSDPVLRRVALQGQGGRIAAVVPRLR
jgi:hypothetical protein